MQKCNHDLRPRTSIRAALVALALGCFSLAASAKAGSEYDAFMSMASGSGKHTVGFTGGGVPIITRGVPGPTAAGNMNFSHAPNGPLNVGGQADLNSPIPGKKLPVNVKAPLNAAGVSKALVGFAKKVGPLATGMAIYDLLGELSLVPTWDAPNQENDFLRTSYLDQWRYNGQNAATASLSSAAAACELWKSDTGRAGMATSAYYIDSPTQHRCYVNGTTGITLTRVAQTPQQTPLSDGEVISIIASQSGWPSTSVIDRAAADAANWGATFTPEVPSGVAITGAQPKVVSDPATTTRSDGSAETSQMECGWVAAINGVVTYNCNTVQTQTFPPKTVTTTVVKTNPDGTTATETLTTTTPSSSITGTSTTAVTEEEKECPDGTMRVSCSTLDTPAGEIPKTSKTITYAEENLFGSGSCPANSTLSLGTLGSSVTVWDWQKTCALALPLRALVVSLATFAAFLIVLPGSTRV